MKILTNTQCENWFHRHGIEMISKEHILIPDDGFRRNFHVPSCSRTQLSLSYSLVEWFQYSNALLWISVWSAVEKYEVEAFIKISRHNATHRNLTDSPGYLFDGNDSENVRSMIEIVFLMMSLNWEGYLVSSSKNCIIWISDQVIEVITKNISIDVELKCLLDDLDVVQY